MCIKMCLQIIYVEQKGVQHARSHKTHYFIQSHPGRCLESYRFIAAVAFKHSVEFLTTASRMMQLEWILPWGDLCRATVSGCNVLLWFENS